MEYQNFERDHELIKSGKARSLTSPHSIKAMLLGLLFWVDAFNFYNYDTWSMMKKLTHWTQWLTLISVSLSLYCSMDFEISKKKSILNLNHKLFEIITPMNLVVTIVYWIMLREESIQNYSH